MDKEKAKRQVEPTPIEKDAFVQMPKEEIVRRAQQATTHGYHVISNLPESLNVVTKPKHYQDKSGKDLFQKWYEEHDFPTFRHIMRAIAERYTSRYENKNGVEDLEKGIYTLQRLKEYELLEVKE